MIKQHFEVVAVTTNKGKHLVLAKVEVKKPNIKGQVRQWHSLQASTPA